MAYIGSSPVIGEFTKLDDISSQFDGVTFAFQLTSGGTAITAESSQNLLISVDGVLQEPGVAYTTSGSSISFTEAPESGATFFGVRLGSVGQVGVVSDGTITTAKIANGAVTEDKIGALAVTEGKIADGSITAAKIADGTVVAAEIADANVTTAKIADSAVIESKIADANVTTAKIADANVTTAKIADDNITTAKIADSAVTSIKLSSNLIFNGTATFLGASVEKANIVASNVAANVEIDNQENGIVYFTDNSTSNVDITVNFYNMDSISVGNTTSFVLMVTNNTDFQAYVGNVQINGETGNLVRWLGGAPTAGTANLNLYSFSVIKTDSSAYTTLASKNEFQ